MFETFYGFSADAFRLTPDHLFSFDHPNFAKAKAYVDYALFRGEGLVMITGRPGTGKTTLIRGLQSRMAGSNTRVAVVANTRLDAEDLLRMSASAFELSVDAGSKFGVLQRLMAFFLSQHQAGRRVLLIIDEAQDLSVSALEELRLLTNLEHAGKPLLQILLVGQEALHDLVHSEGMEQLQQRIVAAWHLTPLHPAETVGYVRHRLEKAGWRGDPSFEPGVLRRIHEFSHGIPRLINLVCSRLLLRGFSLERHVLHVEDVQCVIDELREEGLAPRRNALSNVRTDDPQHDGPSGLIHAAVAGGGTLHDDDSMTLKDDGDWSQIDQGLAQSKANEPSLKHAAPIPAAANRAMTPEPFLRAEEEPGLAHKSDQTAEIMREPDDEPRPAVAPLTAQAPESTPHLSGILVHEDAPEAFGQDASDQQDDWKTQAESPPSQSASAGRRAGYALLFLMMSGLALGGVYWLYPETSQRFVESARDWMQSVTARVASMADRLQDAAEERLAVATPLPEEENRSAATATPQSGTRLPASSPEPLIIANPEVAATEGMRDEAPGPAAPAPVPPLNGVTGTDDQVGQFDLTGEAPASATGQDAVQEPEAMDGAPPNAEPEVTSGAIGEDAAVTAAPPPPQSPPPPPVMLSSAKVLFGFNSIVIEKPFAAALDQIIAVMDKSSQSLAEIQGFSDQTGDANYNRMLSRRRAEAVAAYLVKRGISRERLSVAGQEGADEQAPGTTDVTGRLVQVRVLQPTE